jgi:VanZ family protein
MTVLLRLAAAACFVTLAALSLLPAMTIPRTDLGGMAEHTVAYLGTALVTGMAFRRKPTLVTLCACLILYAASLEALQHFAPGRRPAIADFVAGVTGVILGGACLWLARHRVARWLRLD